MNPTTEIVIRLAATLAIFTGLALWELAGPKRPLSIGRDRRWPNNLGIVLIDTIAVRLLMPTAAVGVAMISAEWGFGLFYVLALPSWLQAVLGFILLDAIIYGQHVVFHTVPILWRVHRVHHADLDVDVTTGVRFHPFEILLSMGIKIVAVLIFGIPPLAVLVFEVVLNATSMFNHANIGIAPRIDRVIRWLVVTPDMHRVHHSMERAETDSNFGFNLPWWDHLFGTYRAEPKAGHMGMTIGLPTFREPGELRLDRLLTQPFRDELPLPPAPGT